MAQNKGVADATETPIMDETAVKALTVEEIGELTIYQLVGLDGRGDLLTAEQARAVAATLKDRMTSKVKAFNKVARAKDKGENEAEWNDFLNVVASELVEGYEETINKRCAYVSLRITRNENGVLEVKHNVRSKRFTEGQEKYKSPHNRQDGSDSEGAEE